MNSNTYKNTLSTTKYCSNVQFFFTRSRVLDVVPRVAQHPPSSTHFYTRLVAFLADRHCNIPNTVFDFVCGLVKILWTYTYSRKTVVLGDCFNTENYFYVSSSKKITCSPNHLLIYNDSELIRWTQTLWRPQESLSCFVVFKVMAVKSDWPEFAYRPIYFLRYLFLYI